MRHCLLLQFSRQCIEATNLVGAADSINIAYGNSTQRNGTLFEKTPSRNSGPQVYPPFNGSLLIVSIPSISDF
jgi:hypothetical protein